MTMGRLGTGWVSNPIPEVLHRRVRSFRAEKMNQFLVDFLGMGPRNAMWSILNHHKVCVRDGLRDSGARGTDGKNAVRITVDDQRGNIDPVQILTEILKPTAHAGEACNGG